MPSTLGEEGGAMKALFRRCGEVCILVALVHTCAWSTATGSVGTVRCQYTWHQNACENANALNFTVGTKIGTVMLGNVAATVTCTNGVVANAAAVGGAVTVNFPEGCPYCTRVSVTVTMTVKGNRCSNQQKIEEGPVWTDAATGQPVAMAVPMRGGWALNARQRNGELDHHRFILWNEDTTCCCIRNIKFHYGPLDLYGQDLFDFDDWMPELYAGGDTMLCPSDSFVLDLALPYEGHLPHIQGYYEIWECPAEAQDEEPVARCWWSHYDFDSYGTESEPQWILFDTPRALLFQDNFPAEDDIESYVRADMALDINPASSGIRPGDSIVVRCIAPERGGIAWDGFGPRVFMHVRAQYIGGSGEPKPDLYGPALEGTYGRFVQDSPPWTVFQAETARTYDGYPFSDRYVFDLNDSLFTRGYQIEYYFSVYDNDGDYATWPQGAASGANYLEFTCLPTLTSQNLFVDGFDNEVTTEGIVDTYYRSMFRAVIAPTPGLADRYDVNSPTALVSNGLASRAKLSHLLSAYTDIFWDSGDLRKGTICDGTAGASGKNNDCQLLIDWMNNIESYCGLWICGDNVASDLNNLGSPAALSLMNDWCGVSLVSGSYFDVSGGSMAGGNAIPLVTGNADAGVFVHYGTPDRFYADGGGERIDEFDCLEKTGTGKYALDYPPYAAMAYHEAIASTRVNSGGYRVATIWFGSSFMHLRDDSRAVPIDRFELFRDALGFLGAGPTKPDITQGESPAAYELAQNFPNPFNPTTAIKFDMKKRGLVTIRVYSVAGELVRTLLNEVRDAGAYSVAWDGRNNLGVSVASGIYLYEMKTSDFSATKKMILLR
jgi:hypothetical protein